MSMQAHVAELERRHEALDKALREETARPASDEVRVNDLKRRKLYLKDEIARLKGTLH
ncbi:YdcH family protein [Ancylobacter sp. G4_0304]|uniref:YdcH family protein n=1 Tax=Ancylobacter sp. G4_0304 TaxID=3114289 RepID=UPI0039C64995